MIVSIHNHKSFLLLLLFVMLVFCYNMDVIAESMARSTDLQEAITEDGNVQRIDYVNKNGDITFAANRHYATCIKTRDGAKVLEEYFDENGNPTMQRLGNFALLKEYNELDQDYKITYLGINKVPVMIRSGCAIVVRTFNQNGKVETETYYDTKEKPVKTKSLGYGSYYGYDEVGRIDEITYLDQGGHPMISGQGFAIVHRNYYEDGVFAGKIESEFLF